MYIRDRRIHYYSSRYKRFVTVPAGYVSDGATGAFDIESKSWWVHDWLCGNWFGDEICEVDDMRYGGPKPPPGEWDDGSKCTNWQASTVLSDILWKEDRYFRAIYWWAATWFLGGGEARKNGMW